MNGIIEPLSIMITESRYSTFEFCCLSCETTRWVISHGEYCRSDLIYCIKGIHMSIGEVERGWEDTISTLLLRLCHILRNVYNLQYVCFQNYCYDTSPPDGIINIWNTILESSALKIDLLLNRLSRHAISKDLWFNSVSVRNERLVSGPLYS